MLHILHRLRHIWIAREGRWHGICIDTNTRFTMQFPALTLSMTWFTAMPTHHITFSTIMTATTTLISTISTWIATILLLCITKHHRNWSILRWIGILWRLIMSIGALVAAPVILVTTTEVISVIITQKGLNTIATTCQQYCFTKSFRPLRHHFITYIWCQTQLKHVQSSNVIQTFTT